MVVVLRGCRDYVVVREDTAGDACEQRKRSRVCAVRIFAIDVIAVYVAITRRNPVQRDAIDLIGCGYSRRRIDRREYVRVVVEFTQVRLAQISLPQIGLTEIGLSQIRLAQIGLT